MRISIFLSYCHDDLKVDERRLKVFIDALQVAGNGVYEIFADYQHPDAGVGSLLPEYMEKINASEAVIILLTPTYKKRIEQKQKTGVYTEFNYIYDKYLEAREKNKYGSSFILMPILYSGTIEDSCPRELLDIIAGDIRWLFVSPSDRANNVRRDIRTRLKEFLKKIAGQIAAISETKKSDYPKRAEELFRKFLFDDTKSGWDKVENHRFLESAIVKTSTFMKVRERKFSIIIGRKGSGKSTITHILPILTEPRPIDVLSLDFEQLPFDMCYNILRTNPAQASDIRHAFSPIYSYQLLWDVFLHLYFTWVALNKLSNRSKLSQTVKKLLKGVFTGNETYFEKRQIATKILFVYAFENLIDFIKKTVDKQIISHELSKLQGIFTPHKFREYVFGSKGCSLLQEYFKVLADNNANVMVTADGFDTMIGYATLDASDPHDAQRFETELLLSLFKLIFNNGPARIGSSAIYDLSKFCIAVPYDRFYDVRMKDRDRYNYRNIIIRSEWSGIESPPL